MSEHRIQGNEPNKTFIKRLSYVSNCSFIQCREKKHVVSFRSSSSFNRSSTTFNIRCEMKFKKDEMTLSRIAKLV